MIFGSRLKGNTPQVKMGDFLLSKKADSDLLDIARFTIKKFGIQQARIDKNGLYDCFKSLAENPDLARDASEYMPNLRRFAFKSHTIFYRPMKTGISIVRVLHQNMDFDHHF